MHCVACNARERLKSINIWPLWSCSETFSCKYRCVFTGHDVELETDTSHVAVSDGQKQIFFSVWLLVVRGNSSGCKGITFLALASSTLMLHFGTFSSWCSVPHIGPVNRLFVCLTDLRTKDYVLQYCIAPWGLAYFTSLWVIWSFVCLLSALGSVVHLTTVKRCSNSKLFDNKKQLNF